VSTATYLIVAGILCAITGLEFGVIYVRRLAPILLPLLLTLSAGKFALVVMFYMHLRYDSRVLTFLFVAPLVLAIGLAVAVTTLTGAFLVYRR
jgi:cytochrome c oxidase subunit 4